MKILGIDPGTILMGYGVIESDGDIISLVDCGAIKTPPKAEIGERLNHLYENLLRIISQHNPEAIAVESPFVSQNVKSALAIGRAQAIALLAAASNHIPAYEYSPARVKQMVSNYGAGSKEQIAEVVRLQLGLATAPQPADATDALAIAICHAQETHLANLIGGYKEKK
jgi:crossover junction endodeoxyribonuclease RuvC